LFAATFSNWVIIAAYNINQQFISTTLCENKSNPSMHCNGHCYLNKQLAKQEQPTSPLNNKSNERFEIQLFCLQQSSTATFTNKAERVYCNQQQNFSAQQFISNNFRPPQV